MFQTNPRNLYNSTVTNFQKVIIKIDIQVSWNKEVSIILVICKMEAMDTTQDLNILYNESVMG